MDIPRVMQAAVNSITHFTLERSTADGPLQVVVVGTLDAKQQEALRRLEFQLNANPFCDVSQVVALLNASQHTAHSVQVSIEALNKMLNELPQQLKPERYGWSSGGPGPRRCWAYPETPISRHVRYRDKPIRLPGRYG